MPACDRARGRNAASTPEQDITGGGDRYFFAAFPLLFAGAVLGVTALAAVGEREPFGFALPEACLAAGFLSLLVILLVLLV